MCGKTFYFFFVYIYFFASVLCLLLLVLFNRGSFISATGMRPKLNKINLMDCAFSAV